MKDAGIPQNIIHIIMNCIKEGSCRLLWNDEATNQIKPFRGLRQGDPLSTYLFILCIEKLTHWIQRQVDEGCWKAVKASRRGPEISHLFFADDIILFSEANEDDIKLIQEILSAFAHSSGQEINFIGQEINFMKSSIYFSPNVSKQEMESLNTLLGIPLTKNLGHYLGFKLRNHGRNKNTHLDLL